MNTFEIMNLIGDAPESLLTGIETAILMRMALIADKHGKNIHPGLSKLIKQTKFSKPTIIKSINSLLKKSVLNIINDRSNGSHTPVCYELNLNILRNNKSVNSKYVNKNLPVSGKGDLPVSGKGDLPVSGKGDLPVSGKGDLLLYKNIPVNELYRTGKGALPETGKRQITHLRLPHITTHSTQVKYVELCDNSTSHSSQKSTPKKSKKLPSKKSESLLPKVREIFDHWQKVLNHPRSILDKKRQSKIIAALNLGYSVDQLKMAIDGIKKTAWNMGNNPDKKIYDAIDLIFRNSDAIERFIGNFNSEGAVKKENVSTARKTTFLDDNRNQLNILDKIEEMLDRDELIYQPEFKEEKKVNELA